MQLDDLRRTDATYLPLILRTVAAVPLIGIGLQHLTGAAPLEPILVSAGIPFAGANAIIAPLFQLLAGALLLTGTLARLGALLAAAQMVVALYTQAVVDWSSEPPFALPVVVFVAALFVLLRGAGALSIDRLLPEQADAPVRA